MDAEAPTPDQERLALLEEIALLEEQQVATANEMRKLRDRLRRLEDRSRAAFESTERAG